MIIPSNSVVFLFVYIVKETVISTRGYFVYYETGKVIFVGVLVG